ncbi:MAG TPA: tryptophan-rich sensory protein [Candidatus Limiplasma sp.]|nr:tryptophan-rich sensory protein [Candidatus Limiplasma sp.]HPS80814.1 tryptophan-rich sensory protein [Candidatus Limiplasma sp.]
MEVTVRNKGIKAGVVLSFVLMVTVNALANILPINGLNTGEAANRYPNLFTPAPITFGIWGAIYLMLTVYVVSQLLPAKKNADATRQKLLAKVGKLFIFSSVMNAAWIFAWHYQQLPLSMAIMVLLLVSLIWIGRLLREPHCSPAEELSLRIPFGLYFGWITVATIANATVLLVSLNWNGFGIDPTVWMAAIVAVGVGIASVTMFNMRSVAYGLAVLWAFAGILYRHLSAQWFGGQYTLVIVAVGIALGFLLCMTAVTAVHMRKVATCRVHS